MSPFSGLKMPVLVKNSSVKLNEIHSVALKYLHTGMQINMVLLIGTFFNNFIANMV